MKLRSIIKKNNNSVVSLIAIVSISSMVCAAYGLVGQECGTKETVTKNCVPGGGEGGCLEEVYPLGECQWASIDVCHKLKVPNNEIQVQVDVYYGDCVDMGSFVKCVERPHTPSNLQTSYTAYSRCW